MMQYRYDGDEPSNWELYRLIVDVHKAVNGNGQKGLVQTVQEHATTLKIVGASLALIGPVVLAGLVARIWPHLIP